jgi:hypothetical protein
VVRVRLTRTRPVVLLSETYNGTGPIQCVANTGHTAVFHIIYLLHLKSFSLLRIPVIATRTELLIKTLGQPALPLEYPHDVFARGKPYRSVDPHLAVAVGVTRVDVGVKK